MSRPVFVYHFIAEKMSDGKDLKKKQTIEHNRKSERMKVIISKEVTLEEKQKRRNGSTLIKKMKVNIKNNSRKIKKMKKKE